MTQAATVAVVQMVSGEDVEDNLRIAGEWIARAADKGAELLVLPENFAVLDGGPVREFAEREGDADAPLQAFLSAAARQHGIYLVGGTIPLLTRPRSVGEASAGEPDLVGSGRVRASSLLFGPDGRQLARYDKIHLFDVDVADAQSRYRESDTFEPGERVVVADIPPATVGMSICYDLRFAELYRQLGGQRAEVVTVPSAFTRVTGEAHWEVLLRARAIENQVYVLAPNQGGRHNANRETWGHSMIIDPWGRVLGCHEHGEGMVVVDIDLDALHELRSKMPVMSHRRL